MFEDFVNSVLDATGIQAMSDFVARCGGRIELDAAKKHLREKYADKTDEQKKFVNEKFEEVYSDVLEGERPSSPVFRI